MAKAKKKKEVMGAEGVDYVTSMGAWLREQDLNIRACDVVDRAARDNIRISRAIISANQVQKRSTRARRNRARRELDRYLATHRRPRKAKKGRGRVRAVRG